MILAYIIGAIFVLLSVSAFFGAPYVPSHRRDIQQLFDEYVPLSENDTVLDIGSGDGVVLREASKRGARAVGYEIHPVFVALSKVLSWSDPRVRVEWKNAWKAAFPSSVTVVYMFGVGRDGYKLATKVQHEVNLLKKPLTLVCYGNALPGMMPERTVGAYHLYIFRPLHLK